MNLPDSLQLAIAEEIQSQSQINLSVAREDLSARYRNQIVKGRLMSSEAHRLSYLVTRMPATYAAVYSVFTEISKIVDKTTLSNFLDLGSGPGTGMWAANEVFPNIRDICLVEQDRELIALGRRLAGNSHFTSLKQARWIEADLSVTQSFPKSDLVLLSYSIGEISEVSRLSLLENSWRSTNQYLVIIEPGTPVGFERMRLFRSQLIEWGGYLLAPCPHANTCPIQGSDWCHFSARLPRTSLHRQVKQGVLGYEDEKFSYLVVSKKPFQLDYARILRHPIKRTGHMHFTLCTSEGIQQKIISKRQGELYKKAKEFEWGGAITRDKGEEPNS